ncbi:major facilitator superfamily domain-containing protein [Whalleya microplaca]|nr:major facilitator superfamily domain-containing protein [Whalleya microplaca]
MDDEITAYPEDDLEAWAVVLGSWCAMLSSMGLLNTLAILQAWISENELPDVPESTIGWILSIYGFCLYFFGAQTGPIFDAHNAQFLVVPGSVGIVASIFFFSFSTELYQYLLSFGVLGGISASLLFNPSIAAIGHWFYKRRALATGIACTAGGIGGIIFPIIIIYAAPRIGFGWAVRIIGFIYAASGLAACCLLRKRLPPNKKGGASIDLKALSEIKFATTTLAIFLIEFAFFIPYTYISSYAIYVGLDTQRAYLLNALLNAGAVPGRALPGYVADRLRTFNTMCVTALTCTAMILAIWLTASSTEASVVAFAPLFGFWSGAAISLTPVCVGQVCKTEDYGKRSGTAFFIASFAALAGIPIAGAILQADDSSYSRLIIFAGSLYGAAVVAFIIARGVSAGWGLGILF